MTDERKKVLPQSLQPMDMGVQSEHDVQTKDLSLDVHFQRIKLAMDLMRSCGMPEDEILLVSKLYVDAFAGLLEEKLKETKCSLKTNSSGSSSTQ